MITYCPTCANMLLVEYTGVGSLRYFCETCPYVYELDKPISKAVPLAKKEVEDVFGGDAAMKHAQKANVLCGRVTSQYHLWWPKVCHGFPSTPTPHTHPHSNGHWTISTMTKFRWTPCNDSKLLGRLLQEAASVLGTITIIPKAAGGHARPQLACRSQGLLDA
ncbi:hypothetical protein WJX84_008686 [Apatococcus fuscideae]|uniref:DNA-directed RNA polymerase II subunit RPB9-like zinc ribbon domain-containing protein n=1 Tax=Apatococcus fuscideae TaxID=2026836 RepID=A0AAW1TCY4_9CHLO